MIYGKSFFVIPGAASWQIPWSGAYRDHAAQVIDSAWFRRLTYTATT